MFKKEKNELNLKNDLGRKREFTDIGEEIRIRNDRGEVFSEKDHTSESGSHKDIEEESKKDKKGEEMGVYMGGGRKRIRKKTTGVNRNIENTLTKFFKTIVNHNKKIAEKRERKDNAERKRRDNAERERRNNERENRDNAKRERENSVMFRIAKGASALSNMATASFALYQAASMFDTQRIVEEEITISKFLLIFGRSLAVLYFIAWIGTIVYLVYPSFKAKTVSGNN